MPDIKPIFLATHPRSCSTAFERIFMTCRETIECVHEPFGDAFYYGPERISPLYIHDEDAIVKSGFKNSTYAVVLRSILDDVEHDEKRVFVKDMAYHFTPPAHSAEATAPSLLAYATTIKPNPTLLPSNILDSFTFTFLIRNPIAAIPSLYRCTVPPLSLKTNVHVFDPSEIGYRELRILLDHLHPTDEAKAKACIIDADNLLADPEGALRTYCAYVGLPFHTGMLHWDGRGERDRASRAFRKFYGFHEAAIESTGFCRGLAAGELAHRTPSGAVVTEGSLASWTREFGSEAATVLSEAVEANMRDYLYLRRFVKG